MANINLHKAVHQHILAEVIGLIPAFPAVQFLI